MPKDQEIEMTLDPFWFFWFPLMGLLSFYLYHNCETQRRNARMLQEYEAFLQDSDERLDRLERERMERERIENEKL